MKKYKASAIKENSNYKRQAFWAKAKPDNISSMKDWLPIIWFGRVADPCCIYNNQAIYRPEKSNYFMDFRDEDNDIKKDFTNVRSYVSFLSFGNPNNVYVIKHFDRKDKEMLFKPVSPEMVGITDREEMISNYYNGLKDFIAMTNTNLYDGIYYSLHFLNTIGRSAFSQEIKADANSTETKGRNELMMKLKDNGFIIRALAGYFEAIRFDKDGIIEASVYLIYGENEIIVVTRDTPEIPEYLNKLITPYKNHNVPVYEYNRPGPNLSSETKELSYNDKKHWHPEFYPWMKDDFEIYINEFLSSNNNALILIGPPGTGKTSWLKQYILRQDNPVMYSANTEVISSGLLFSEFSSSDAKTLIMEDADTITGKREDGNNIMSQLLNSLSGITAENDKKIIISTNLPNLNKVDPALIRPGRCFDVLYFSLLSKEEANIARKAINLEPIEFKKDKLTLAEALNYMDEEDLKIRSQSSAGFV